MKCIICGGEKPEQEKEWPEEHRIDVIGHNGNNGEHYQDDAIRVIQPHEDDFCE